jgi:hypothetical protein
MHPTAPRGGDYEECSSSESEAQDQCSLEWIQREALWRCHRREDSVRHL